MSIEEKVVGLLKCNKMILTTAESCTGGMIASTIVNVSGASNVFHQGYITYCDDAKNSILKVRKEILDKYKAVSPQVACEMALGALEVSGADVAVSVTGVAGPSMEDGKPVGLVYIGVVSHKESVYVAGFDKCLIAKDIDEFDEILKNSYLHNHNDEVAYISQKGSALIKKNMFSGNRSTIRQMACEETLNILKTYLYF